MSEQEARFLFSQEIEVCKKAIYYSVETPTNHKYKFKGKKETSASSDLSLFEISNDYQFIKKVNIEFKAHNVDQTQFTKDFKKLLKEQSPNGTFFQGLFFQVLESVNNGTLTVNKEQKGILIKYRKAFMELSNEWEKNSRKDDWFIHFAIYSHNPHFLLSKTFTKQSFNDINSFFNLRYNVEKQKFTLLDRNGWKMHTI